MDLYFWKRITLYGVHTGLEEPYTKALKPHDRLFLVASMQWIEFDITFMYTYDERGKKRSNADLLEAFAAKLCQIAKALRSESKEKKQKKKQVQIPRLQYVEISNDQRGGGIESDEDLRSPSSLNGDFD
jgi:hypothetical protein